MENLIKLLESDLNNYSKQDLDTLARYHGTDCKLKNIAEYNARKFYKSANMNNSTYSTDQIGDVVNIINNSTNINIALRTALVITTYTDKPDVDFYSTMYLDIKPQADDVYNCDQGLKFGTSDGPLPMINEILSVGNVPRYAAFAIWVKRDGRVKGTPVLSSHLTLIVADLVAPNSFKVYKYNSGFTDDNIEARMDTGIKNFFKLVGEYSNNRYSMIPTYSWCPKYLQGSSNLCTVFVFHLYYLLSTQRNVPIKHILMGRSQDMETVGEFLQELQRHLQGRGDQTIKW